MRRSPLVLTGYAVLALAIAALLVAIPLRGRAATRAPDRLAGTEVWPAGSRPAPAFNLLDQSGHRISTTGLRQRIWAVTFLDAHCTQACPVVARDLAQVQRTLGPANPLTVVIVSVLPGYDTPARVRAFARNAGLEGDWHWLLGTRHQLEPVWSEYGIYVQTGIQHTAAVYLVDRRGDVRVADAVPFYVDQFAGSVRALARPAGTHNQPVSS